MDIAYPIAAALLVMLVSLAGIIFSAQVFASWVHRNLTYLASFAGGVFLIVIYHLLEETLHEGSLSLAAGAVLFGATLMVALHHLLPDAHHHHDVSHDHAHTPIDGRRVLVSDALHNVGDGVLLVAAFAVNATVGFTAAIGVVLHELVQEISEFFVLREAGYNNREALLRNFISSSTILVGVGVALFLAAAEEIAILFAGIAAGGFLVVLVQDVLPHAIHSTRAHGGAWLHVGAAILGITVMLGVQFFFGHEEAREEDLALTPLSQTLSRPS
ncbi:MAG TPA: ZIP family metal transporter [Candidatus Paceibacterota bacterium]|nr:ZIP family metal transporter [Candidatus Paceibacterota bacterium]